jgi:autotransporter translocation and assembly factor TamB
VGLDVIRIERAKPTDDAPTTGGGDFAGRVEVGKYINDRVYVSYAHRFGATERQNANEAHAEYRLSPHWLAETVFGDAGVGGVDAFWVYRY